MLNVLIAIGVFATILLFIQAAQNIYTTVLGPEHQRFRRRLRRAAEQQSESSLLLVKTLHITFPWFDKLIARMPPGLQRLPAQANVRVSLEKITFGIETEQALKNLVQRIDSVDLKFFVTAAVIQRETGGNLAEIVEAISEVIRQRFDMQSRTQSLTAEGRLSAVVLFAMPI